MITIEQALDAYAASIKPLATETIATAASLHRVLADAVTAATDLPRFDQSAMDGYALRAAEVATASAGLPCRLPIVQAVAAGDAPGSRLLPIGGAARILTGAPLPVGADTVVAQERVTRDGDLLTFTAAVPVARNIRRRGDELLAGSSIAAAGARVTPGLLASMINAGADRVRVRLQPRLRLIVSGDEILRPGDAPQAGRIPDSNGPLVRAVLSVWGLPLPASNPVGDDFEATRQTLQDAFADADVVISTGGASVGDRDFLPAAAESIGVRRVFWRVSQKPGKPLYFGVLDDGSRVRALLCLPGNPGAVLIGLALHLRRIIDILEDARPQQPLWASGLLTRPVERDSERDRLLRMRLEYREGRAELSPLPHQDSHMLSNLASADVLARIAPGEEPVPTGSVVSWMPLP